jgi:predicted RNA-binding Zn-ribbon protein involved in translation (DUF1610 family)
MTNNKTIQKCSECESDFYTESSLMKSLCPECSHNLYGYQNCKHEFKNKRCIHCYWDGNTSEYLKK